MKCSAYKGSGLYVSLVTVCIHKAGAADSKHYRMTACSKTLQQLSHHQYVIMFSIGFLSQMSLNLCDVTKLCHCSLPLLQKQ